MTDALLQHPPAIKVGGRRLSVPTRPKPVILRDTTDRQTLTSTDDDVVDYPRPAAPGEQIVHQHHPHEDEQPKTRRALLDEHERRILETAQRKAEMKATKDHQAAGKNTGGMRINQPAGKVVAV